MLQIPNLDDITYEQLLQNAIHKIPQLTREWTDFNLHDPGITTLEIYAWLTDMLNYYINASGDIHVKKYMKLLGIEQKKSSPAISYLKVMLNDNCEQDLAVIPKGLPVYAQDRCFTTLTETAAVNNSLTGIYTGKNGQLQEITEFAGTDGAYISVFDRITGKNQELYLAFEKPLSQTTDLFFQVKEEEIADRAVIGKQLSKLLISYYDGSAWKKAEILSDSTGNLMQSGCMTLKVDGAMKPDEKTKVSGYLLKLEAAENHYDIPPAIGSIFLNPAAVIQKEEICRRISIPLMKGQKEYEIPEYVSGMECAAVGIRRSGDSKSRILLDFSERENENCSVDLSEKCVKLSASYEEGELDIFLANDEAVSFLEIGAANGCSGQEYQVFADSISDIEVIIRKADAEGDTYEIWNCIDQLESAGSRDKVFIYDEAAQSVRFGDGVHGLVPREGQIVQISRLSVSAFEKGNVLAGEINSIKDPAYEILQAVNVVPAKGGRRTESVEEMQKRLEEKILVQNRVIAASDYEEKVMSIPGLKVRGTKVISAAEYAKNHGTSCRPYEVWVIVCPDNADRTGELSQAYQDVITSWLEPYRMVNTRIRVTAPSWAGIHVSGRILVRDSKQEAAKEVEALIKSTLENLEKDCRFGSVISYGDLFMQLEALDCVSRVEELHIAVGGTMGHKNDRGDILLNSDCLPYCGNITFEYK